MPKALFFNLTYVCNERCVFCAADVALEREPKWMTSEAIESWLDAQEPEPDDEIMVAGGEPTLHPQFHGIVRIMARRSRNVTIFTNGLRLADLDFAEKTIEAGVTSFEIALFGATEERHDAITQIRGSFVRTIEAMRILSERTPRSGFRVILRLLFSRQTSFDNPAIVCLAGSVLPNVDAISLNRLILSDTAKATNSTIAWDAIRTPVNDSARLARRLGYEVIAQAIPLCVFDNDVLSHVLKESANKCSELRYMDVNFTEGRPSEKTSMARMAIPDICLRCELRERCGGVEGWYVAKHGLSGLSPIRTVEVYSASNDPLCNIQRP